MSEELFMIFFKLLFYMPLFVVLSKNGEKAHASRIFNRVLKEMHINLSSEREEEKKKWFFENVYHKNKAVFLFGCLPIIGIFSITIRNWLDGTKKEQRRFAGYKTRIKEELQISTPEPEEKEPNEPIYFIRYGENAHFSTIRFTMDGDEKPQIIEAVGPFSLLNEKEQAEVLGTVLACLKKGLTDGFGYSSNLIPYLAEAENEKNKITERSPFLARIRKRIKTDEKKMKCRRK